jgi:transcriptional regulator PpsR
VRHEAGGDSGSQGIQVSIAQPDITLLLDLKGVIQRVSLSNEVSGEQAEPWLGRPWIETADEAASDKIRRIVEEARSEGLSAFRQVNQRFPSGRELPIEYTTIRLGGRAGLLAVGRNLQAVAELQSRLIAAQQAMERDYWKLREVETRYRLLFDTSNEAVLLVRASDLVIVEANPMAIRALGLAPHGRELLREIAPADREPFQTMLQRVREQGRAPGILAHLGPEQRSWLARATPVVADPGYVFLLQLSPVGTALPAAEAELPDRLGALLERVPDAVVLLDREGTVHWVNRAFLDLVQCPLPRAVLGERLGRWLDRPGADLEVLLAALDRHGAVRGFSSAIRGELGSEVEVEISAVADAGREARRLLLVLRDIGWRPQEVSTDRAAGAVPSLDPTPGRAPLQQLVREAVEQLERQHILASLERTGGNRTAAAALLGLSRQSLYAKLERYGLDGGSAGNGAAEPG